MNSNNIKGEKPKSILRDFVIWFMRKCKSLNYKFIFFINKLENQGDIRYYSNRISLDVELGNSILDGLCSINSGCTLIGNVHIGHASTIGSNCMLHGTGGSIKIGKYSQIAPNVAIYGNNHPISYLSTYVNKNLFDGSLGSLCSGNDIDIGNDVWVGHGAIILNGVKISNGAIIGAGAIVKHDVPPYAIVAGTPARIIRYRFAPEVISLLQTLAWWDLEDRQLQSIRDLFFIDSSKSTDEFIYAIKNALAKINHP